MSSSSGIVEYRNDNVELDKLLCVAMNSDSNTVDVPV